MMRVLVSITLGLLSLATGLAAPLSPFVFVMIDAQTEALHGNLPFNRALVAKAIDKLAAANAKGIVLKFFYDLPSTEETDHALELSICAPPVALQAGLDDNEGTTNALEAKFEIDANPPRELPLAGDKGLLPLRRFSRCAYAVGFVDSFNGTDEIPLIELYQGRMVKSLWLVALEMASNQKAHVDPSGDIRFDKEQIGINVTHHINFPSTNSLSYIPFHEILSNAAKTWQGKVRQSVVIIGYDGKKIHSIDTSMGSLSAHRFFIYGLLSLSKSFEENGKRK
jgi:hypothetical protein